MKKTLYRLTPFFYLMVLLGSVTFCYAQEGRIPIPFEGSIKKSSKTPADEEKKDFYISIDKEKLTNAKFIVLWVEDTNQQVVISKVLNEIELTGKSESLEDVFIVDRKSFYLRFNGLMPGDYIIHVRIIINENQTYVIDKLETVS
jgi:hypothetical protein